MNKIKPDDLESIDHISELEMYLPTKKNIFIVEGRSDLEFFNLLLTKTNKNIIPFVMGDKGSNNCRQDIINLFDSIKEIQDNPNVIGVIDADFNTNENIKYNNLKKTEFCDLDCYLIFANNFLNFVINLLVNEKIIKSIGMNPGENLEVFRKYLLTALLPLSKMRSINGELQIPFNDILKKSPAPQRKERYKKLSKFIDKQYYFNLELFYRYLTSNIGKYRIELSDLIEKLDLIELTNLDVVTNGHDLISLLTLLIKVNKSEYDDLKTEEALRLTMNLEMFDEFELTRQVKIWFLSIEEQIENKILTE
ncbi:DUF4435 domain-containing protein [Priestia aryabhattai]|uniref:DUF4435 domain-containing protein n=1 Tax=Priestia aryabhattai TaxID=412384 RepID=UPI001C0DE72C|nr:DUF4435 domain-containing protein [Priestia aryabhattai]MBU3568663.1 DUF4435 domain-containing protein [Priestia aryabhattai]